MTKRGKIIGSIVAMLFIAIMIPVAIFASRTDYFRVNNNYVRYNVDDFQGDFYIALIGNAPDEHENSTDIGTLRTENNKTLLAPSKFFTAGYYAEDKDYSVYCTYNNANTKNVGETLYFPGDCDVLLDKDHKDVSYYFVFVNTALNNTTLNDNRAVNVKTSTRFSGNYDTIETQWSYATGTIASDKFATTSTFAIPDADSNSWIQAEGTRQDFYEPIKVEARNSSTDDYHYIVLQFHFHGTNDLVAVDNQITLTIYLTSDFINE